MVRTGRSRSSLVPLSFIRQAGASAVFTSLHQNPYGEAWPRETIRERKQLIEAAGLHWAAVKSVPVHEDIKTGRGDLQRLFDNYTTSLRNLAAEGLHTVIHNFMPVLDWVRTDMRWPLPDDSPFSLLGLPRIVSTAVDVESTFQMADSPSNGLCFCTGSFRACADNDLPAMAKQFGPRIHAAHLRSTQREADGSFYEADHLAGSMDMPAVVSELLDAQSRRAGSQIPFRPDHAHTMMDDLPKPHGITPGYSCIGRMRGLAELRGLILGLRRQSLVQR